MSIEYVGRDAIVQADTVAFTYQVSENPRDFQEYRPKEDLKWDNRHNVIGDFIVYPYGNNNDLPEQIKDVVLNNHSAPGILNKKTQMLWGMGPQLYREVLKDGKVAREWVENSSIREWLESWDYADYIMRMCVDYGYMQGVYTKFEQSRGSRIGKNFIAKLEHVSVDKARLASLRAANSNKPTHVLVTDWSFTNPNALAEYKAYDKFDFARPFEFKNAILYSNMYSFCTEFYTVPEMYGLMEWLRRSTAVPLIFKALSKNGINLKYHIISPQPYWDKKREELQEKCTQRGIPYEEKMLKELEEETLNTIKKVLSGEENTGKFLHTKKGFVFEGNNLLEMGWEVKVVDQNIKDFVESQIAIADRSDRAISIGSGLHGSLGNVAVNGKSDSGSEQLYAFKNFLNSGVNIPEMIIMKAINYAIKANFPGSGLKLGFFHEVAEREQDVNPEDRVKNN